MMNKSRRVFSRNFLIYTGLFNALGVNKVAYGCMGGGGKEYRSINIYQNNSDLPLLQYLHEFYNSEPTPDFKNCILIDTEYDRSGSSFNSPLKVEVNTNCLPNYQKEIVCSKIDIFTEIFGESKFPEYIYKIASFDFYNKTKPYISLRYRRDFYYSRLIVVATLNEKTSNNRVGMIYNRTDTLVGNNFCWRTFPK